VNHPYQKRSGFRKKTANFFIVAARRQTAAIFLGN
jgi:hypothetical protein